MLINYLHIVLADFGTARSLFGDKNVTLYSFKGPRQLCPPEMVRKYTIAVDMWLTGVLLLSCYTGWDKEKMGEVLCNRGTHPFIELPEEIAPDLKDLLNRMLERKPEYRLSIIQFVFHPFISTRIKQKRKKKKKKIGTKKQKVG